MTTRKLGFHTPEEEEAVRRPLDPTTSGGSPPNLYKPNPDPRTPGFLSMVVNGVFEVYAQPQEFRIAGPSGSFVIRPGADGDLHIAYESPFMEPTIILYKGCGGAALQMQVVRAVTPQAPGAQMDVPDEHNL